MIGDIAQIITALAAVGALLLSWSNNRKIEAVHVATNSLTDRLVATTRTEAHAAGAKEQRDKDAGTN
jgi:hypothetical protein